MQQLQTSSEICFEVTAQIIAADGKKKKSKKIPMTTSFTVLS